MFEDILSKIKEPSRMTIVTPEEIRQELEKFPMVPPYYFDFMREVGWGELGGMMIYSGLIEAGEIYPSIDPPTARIVLFGDNWQGSHYGFDLEDEGQLVEVTPEGEVEPVDGHFVDLVAKYAG